MQSHIRNAGGILKSWLRRVRAGLGMGLTWAAAWAPVGLIFALVAPDRLDEILVSSSLFAGLGLLTGSIFSVALSVVERRRRLDEMSVIRFALWGAAAGLLLGTPLVAIALTAAAGRGGFLGILGTLALLGAGSAAGSLVLARRADDQELLEAANEVAGVGITDAEKRQLLAE